MRCTRDRTGGLYVEITTAHCYHLVFQNRYFLPMALYGLPSKIFYLWCRLYGNQPHAFLNCFYTGPVQLEIAQVDISQLHQCLFYFWFHVRLFWGTGRRWNHPNCLDQGVRKGKYNISNTSFCHIYVELIEAPTLIGLRRPHISAAYFCFISFVLINPPIAQIIDPIKK